MREEDVESLALFTVVTDDDARAADNLSWVSLSVDLAETSPADEKKDEVEYVTCQNRNSRVLIPSKYSRS